jgi:hypothetical protein
MESKPKIIKIEYQGEIFLEFKKIKIDKDNIEIFLSNETESNKLVSETSCITIQINKIEKTANLLDINKNICFEHEFFELKKIGTFYLILTLKMLKKYQEKFNINKIIVRDNSDIECNKETINLSFLHFLKKGITWYMKFGFELSDEIEKQKFIKMSNTYKKLLVSDIIWNLIYDKMIENEKYKKINNEYFNFLKNLILNNKKKKLIDVLDYILNKKDKELCLIFSLLILSLKSYLSEFYKIDIENFKSYHLKLIKN